MSPTVWYFLLFLFALVDSQDYFLKKDYSLVAPYFGTWQFYGSCFINPQYVRLTSDAKSQKGGIYNTKPFFSPAWEVQLSFKVHGSTGRMFGDGFAFWFTSDRLTMGDAFGSNTRFRGLGVFFDTYNNHNGDHNHEHPYISAMLSNGDHVYDHDRDGTHTQLSGCSSQFRNKPHEVVAAIRYSNSQLKVSIDIDNSGNWVECFVVKDVDLPTGYYFGLSAATGDLSDNHDIHWMKVYQLDTANEVLQDRTKIVPRAGRAEKPREHTPDPAPRSSFWTIVWWLFVLGLLCAACYGIYAYLERKKRREKRFY